MTTRTAAATTTSSTTTTTTTPLAGRTTNVAGGRVLLPDGSTAERDVVCTDGVIAAIVEPGAPAPDDVVDATGCLVAPGLIDAQINGAFGDDFTSDPASIPRVAALLPRFGITAFAPTVITAPRSSREAAIAAARAPVAPGAAVPIGLHFEGPMISPERAGAHPTHRIAPLDRDEVATWSRADVALVTLAPDVAGAVATIRQLRALGITASIGHTACTSAEFADALAAGATCVTHLYNAMAPFGHRSPGPIGATLADDSVVAGVICDGLHVDPVAVRMAWRSLAPDRLMLVSDAVAALGARGAVALGADSVARRAGGVRNRAGILAGSDLPLDQAVRNMVEFTGCTLPEAIRCATEVPARLLGLHDRGRIEVGARADLVVVDDVGAVLHTIVGGVSAWRS